MHKRLDGSLPTILYAPTLELNKGDIKMICQKCGIPMDTEKATGYMRPKDYVTAEIKICRQCGLRVKESYRAEVIEEIKE